MSVHLRVFEKLDIDELLKEVTNCLKFSFCASDTVARLIGDERVGEFETPPHDVKKAIAIADKLMYSLKNNQQDHPAYRISYVEDEKEESRATFQRM